MRMHGEGLRRCQLQLLDLPAHIPGDELDGRLHCRHHPCGFRDALQTRLAEVFLPRNGTDRIHLFLDVTRNELAMATYASL
jgi:hypothetical protein